MHFIFRPGINYVLRHLMRPFARFIHPDFHPRVTGPITVPLPGKTDIQLACNPTSYMAKMLFFQGVQGWEYGLFRVFVDLVKQSSVFLDVGANIGYYSLLASAYNPEIHVVSFEPLPSAYRYLKKNVSLNACACINPVCVALSDTVGSARFFASRDPAFAELNDHLTATGGLNEELSSRTEIVETFDVETNTLDRYTEEHLPDRVVDLIKLDTEGSEHKVLKGATTVLDAHRPIVLCEVLPDTIEAELEELFRRHGYIMFRATEKGLVKQTRLCPQDETLKDHLMVPPVRMPRVKTFVTPT